jgi:hypothetical protein
MKFKQATGMSIRNYRLILENYAGSSKAMGLSKEANEEKNARGWLGLRCEPRSTADSLPAPVAYQQSTLRGQHARRIYSAAESAATADDCLATR